MSTTSRDVLTARQRAERFMDGGQEAFDDPEEFNDAVDNLECLILEREVAARREGAEAERAACEGIARSYFIDAASPNGRTARKIAVEIAARKAP